MSAISRFLAAFRSNDDGATAIEYCIVSVFVSAGIIFIASDIGSVLVSFFEGVSAGFQ